MEKFVNHDYPNEYPEIEFDYSIDNGDMTVSYKIKENWTYIKKEMENAQWYNRTIIIHKDSGFKSLGAASTDAIHWLEQQKKGRR